MADITSANAVFILSVPLLLPVPQQLQGFATDDIFSTDDVDATEVMMGVDGILSGGVVLAAIAQGISLQADSASNGLFDAWYQGQRGNVAAYPAQGIITLSSIGKSYVMNTGYLTRYKPMADAKKVLQPRQYRITWQAVYPVPVGAGG